MIRETGAYIITGGTHVEPRYSNGRESDDACKCRFISGFLVLRRACFLSLGHRHALGNPLRTCPRGQEGVSGHQETGQNAVNHLRVVGHCRHGICRSHYQHRLDELPSALFVFCRKEDRSRVAHMDIRRPLTAALCAA